MFYNYMTITQLSFSRLFICSDLKAKKQGILQNPSKFPMFVTSKRVKKGGILGID